MDDILNWPPVIWTARAFIVIVVGGGSWTVGLYLARFLRPKHFWKLITAELPKFKDVSGTMKVFGQELAAHATLDTVRDRENEALDRRVSILEEQVRDFAALGSKALESTKPTENRND
ncbi:MAG TPA: hypothetical protein VM890_05440 [Longimicrobium sp.]|nr:hypothetical protein [Longimicrobium sp.]